MSNELFRLFENEQLVSSQDTENNAQKLEFDPNAQIKIFNALFSTKLKELQKPIFTDGVMKDVFANKFGISEEFLENFEIAYKEIFNLVCTCSIEAIKKGKTITLTTDTKSLVEIVTTILKPIIESKIESRISNVSKTDSRNTFEILEGTEKDLFVHDNMVMLRIRENIKKNKDIFLSYIPPSDAILSYYVTNTDVLTKVVANVFKVISKKNTVSKVIRVYIRYFKNLNYYVKHPVMYFRDLISLFKFLVKSSFKANAIFEFFMLLPVAPFVFKYILSTSLTVLLLSIITLPIRIALKVIKKVINLVKNRALYENSAYRMMVDRKIKELTGYVRVYGMI